MNTDRNITVHHGWHYVGLTLGRQTFAYMTSWTDLYLNEGSEGIYFELLGGNENTPFAIYCWPLQQTEERCNIVSLCGEQYIVKSRPTFETNQRLTYTLGCACKNFLLVAQKT